MKPLLRGRFHEAAFFMALGACIMLLSTGQGAREVTALSIYSASLVILFGISALYHRVHWQENTRMWLRRLDHSAISILIAGSITPLCLIAMPKPEGVRLLVIFWIAACVGILQSMFWVKAPKWFSAVLYVGMGCLAVPYLSELENALGFTNLMLLLIGAVIYALGALVYALKRPNPYPETFGYHEIFHLAVVVAATFHFIVIQRVVN